MSIVFVIHCIELSTFLQKVHKVFLIRKLSCKEDYSELILQLF